MAEDDSISINEGILFESMDREAQKVATSSLGTPVMSNIKFQEFQYETEQGVEKFEDNNVEGDSYLRIDLVTFQVNNKKHLKRTNIPGSKIGGTVKEYISDGDHRIEMRGKLINNEAKRRPEQQIEKFEEIRSAPVPLDIVCPFLAAFGIERIVIEDGRIGEIKGSSRMVTFSIVAYSEGIPEADIDELSP
jgi:hypothetical protein